MRATPGRDNKELLTIQQVSRRLDVTTHTLRFWEKEFDGLIVPLRTPGGQRRYTEENVELLSAVCSLRQQGLSLAEIRTTFDLNGSLPEPVSSEEKLDLLARRVAEAVRAVVADFLTRERI